MWAQDYLCVKLLTVYERHFLKKIFGISKNKTCQWLNFNAQRQNIIMFYILLEESFPTTAILIWQIYVNAMDSPL